MMLEQEFKKEVPLDVQHEKPSEVDNSNDDIIGVPSYKAEERRKQDFWPWHKPRKQYVREYQWCEEIRQLIATDFPEGSMLKYLGLPGDDFLDLRYFHDRICQPNNLKIKFLGFNEGIRSEKRKTEINISLDELSRMDFFHPSSEIIPDDFCDIANVDSLAWEKTRNKGPYDVINIDLCDSFGKQAPNQFLETHYTAISKLLSLQSKRRDPWLLLITTRTGTKDIHEDVFKVLKKLYNDNLLGCAEFQKASLAKFSMGDSATLDQNCATEKGLSDVFMISLCKWLSKLAVKDKLKLEVRSVMGYKVYGGAAYSDLVSIAIKFDPLLIAEDDSLGLAQKQTVDTMPDDCEMAVQALNSIFLQVDADQILADNKELWDEVLQESTKLLNAARYDTTGYELWATLKKQPG